jgi:thiamine pyrophosphate-dependent acetolactate synthase large subunit-like protein
MSLRRRRIHGARCKIAMTPPMEPVLINADMDLQEEAIHRGEPAHPEARAPVPQGRAHRARRNHEMARRRPNPVIIADGAPRQDGGS